MRRRKRSEYEGPSYKPCLECRKGHVKCRWDGYDPNINPYESGIRCIRCERRGSYCTEQYKMTPTNKEKRKRDDGGSVVERKGGSERWVNKRMQILRREQRKWEYGTIIQYDPDKDSYLIEFDNQEECKWEKCTRDFCMLDGDYEIFKVYASEYPGHLSIEWVGWEGFPTTESTELARSWGLSIVNNFLNEGSQQIEKKKRKRSKREENKHRRRRHTEMFERQLSEGHIPFEVIDGAVSVSMSHKEDKDAHNFFQEPAIQLAESEPELPEPPRIPPIQYEPPPFEDPAPCSSSESVLEEGDLYGVQNQCLSEMDSEVVTGVDLSANTESTHNDDLIQWASETGNSESNPISSLQDQIRQQIEVPPQLPRGLVLENYTARDDFELSVHAGEMIVIIDSLQNLENRDWWHVQDKGGRRGFIPSNHVQQPVEVTSRFPRGTVLYDFPPADAFETC